jgi:hypothetical protein
MRQCWFPENLPVANWCGCPGFEAKSTGWSSVREPASACQAGARNV